MSYGHGWQNRVCTEAAELGDRIEKLKVFLTTDKFDALEKMDRELLYQQYNAMLKYQLTLLQRITRFQP